MALHSPPVLFHPGGPHLLLVPEGERLLDLRQLPAAKGPGGELGLPQGDDGLLLAPQPLPLLHPLHGADQLPQHQPSLSWGETPAAQASRSSRGMVSQPPS